jgi:hypothetical protein
MIVFIDESGIHKQVGHSSASVVYVWARDLDTFEKGIENLNYKLKIDFFHWAESSWELKEKYLTGVGKLDFLFKVIVFDNPIKYQQIIEVIFKHLLVEDIDKVFIDGKKPEWYERKLKKVLRDMGSSVKKLKTIRNESAHPGIQLADAIAGLFRYQADNPNSTIAASLVKRLNKNKVMSGSFYVDNYFSKKNPDESRGQRPG